MDEFWEHFLDASNSIQVNLFHQVATHKQINAAVGAQVEPLGDETVKRPYGHLVCCHLPARLQSYICIQHHKTRKQNHKKKTKNNNLLLNKLSKI